MRWRSMWATAAVVLGCGGATVSPRRASDAAPDQPSPDALVTPPDVPVVTSPDVVMVTPDVPVVTPPDVPLVTPDVVMPTGRAPLGAMCATDAECESGLCALSAGLRAGCARPCTSDAMCRDLGSNFSCAVDRAPSGARLACNDAPGATGDVAARCTADAQCFNNLCLDGMCHNPCGAPTDCVAGWSCVATPVSGRLLNVCNASPITGVTMQDFLLFEDDLRVDSTTDELRVVAPPDTVSLTWVSFDLGGQNLLASVTRVIAPGGEDLVNSRTWSLLRDQTIRTFPTHYQINMATRATRDDDAVTPGLYRSTHALFNDRMGTAVATRRLRAQVRIKRAPGGRVGNGWPLRLVVYLVGLSGGPTAATAPSNRRLQAAITQMRTLYASAGIALSVAAYRDVTGADASTYSVIDSREEFQQLLTRTVGLDGDVLPLFFVRGISASAGLEGAIGVAGAIDGPPGIHGTISSGVVAGWDTTLGRTDLLGQVISHECGHYLGLWHVVEHLAACTTAGQSDCSAFGGVDPISDTPTTAAAASRYLMNWTTDGSNTTISTGESVVMRMHPLVH